MALRDVNINEFTSEQLAESRELTKKKMNTYKLLAIIFLLMGGIGLFLPFGKLAQLYTIGYAQLRGKRTEAALWAYSGFIMSLFIGIFLGKIIPSLNTPRIILPSDYED
ncbi:MAG: hypothetical protein IKD28_03670 [Clostridia bacterium]|nr:hypothetical protein [Clostridia bacterium]